MTRNDLASGHDGWQVCSYSVYVFKDMYRARDQLICVIKPIMQVLDPTSRQQQGGGHRIGPVSVSTVREGMGGDGDHGTRGKGEKRGEKDRGQRTVKRGCGEGRNSNGAEYIISEVNADLRFLRVSKSYASITNRILSVALVRHDQIGVQLLAGCGASLDPLNVTNAYKQVEQHDETSPTHLPTRSRDCTVEVSMADKKLGETLELSVTVTNHGPLLRTLDGKVEGHIIR